MDKAASRRRTTSIAEKRGGGVPSVSDGESGNAITTMERSLPTVAATGDPYATPVTLRNVPGDDFNRSTMITGQAMATKPPQRPPLLPYSGSQARHATSIPQPYYSATAASSRPAVPTTTVSSTLPPPSTTNRVTIPAFRRNFSSYSQSSTSPTGGEFSSDADVVRGTGEEQSNEYKEEFLQELGGGSDAAEAVEAEAAAVEAEALGSGMQQRQVPQRPQQRYFEDSDEANDDSAGSSSLLYDDDGTSGNTPGGDPDKGLLEGITTIPYRNIQVSCSSAVVWQQ